MRLFLGLDLSTQGFKALLIDAEHGRIVHRSAVNFGKDLVQYRSPEGYLPSSDPLFRHADPGMWLAALDLLFGMMKSEGVPLGEVRGISGSAQQHGSVYLNESFDAALSRLGSADDLASHFQSCYSRPTAPIWLDRSTSRHCQELAGHFGVEIARRTGSPAIERFAGPQIRKFAGESPEAWQATSQVHLISSFMASVLAGKSAPVDSGDGAGMNLLNLHTLDWDREIADFTAPDLLRKLPAVGVENYIYGELNRYFCRYGFREGTLLTVWSGDNPSSLVGTGGAVPGQAVISLGTSDTLFAAMSRFYTDPAGYGHVFGNPLGGFMSLSCFSNGSLAREKVMKECGMSFAEFDMPLERHPYGNLITPYFEAECTPLVLIPGPKYNFDWRNAPAPLKVRAIQESQALTMKLHSEWLKLDFTSITVTGGASGSLSFRQILADVFQAPVARIGVTDSAALGAALRAAENPAEVAARFCAPVDIVEPDPRADYSEVLQQYAILEK